MFYALVNDTVLYVGGSIADCITYINSNRERFREGDIIKIAQTVRTASVTITITIV